MAVLSLLFGRLHVPLAKHKCSGPTHCLEYLGIILDSWNMVARLPTDNHSIYREDVRQVILHKAGATSVIRAFQFCIKSDLTRKIICGIMYT